MLTNNEYIIKENMENKLYNDTEIELSAREIEDSSENDNESIY